MCLKCCTFFLILTFIDTPDASLWLFFFSLLTFTRVAFVYGKLFELVERGTKSFETWNSENLEVIHEMFQKHTSLTNFILTPHTIPDSNTQNRSMRRNKAWKQREKLFMNFLLSFTISFEIEWFLCLLIFSVLKAAWQVEFMTVAIKFYDISALFCNANSLVLVIDSWKFCSSF